MNLQSLLAPYVAAINPTLLVTIHPSIGGYTIADDGTRTPNYGEPYEVNAQVQALQYQDLIAIQGMQIAGVRKAIYLSAPVDGIVRPEQKGGDLITIPHRFDGYAQGSLWLIALLAENWYSTGGWNKVIATLQNDQIAPPAPKATPVPQLLVTRPAPVAPVATGPFYISFGTPGSFNDELPSEYDGNYVLIDYPLPIPVTIPLNFVGSIIPICRVAPLTNVSLILQWIPAGGSPTTIATVNFPAGLLTGYYSSSQAWNIPRGDSLRLIAPLNVDKTLAELSGTIIASKVAG